MLKADKAQQRASNAYQDWRAEHPNWAVTADVAADIASRAVDRMGKGHHANRNDRHHRNNEQRATSRESDVTNSSERTPTNVDADSVQNRHGVGRNDKNKNIRARQSAAQKLEEAKKRLEEAKASGLSQKELRPYERQVKHWKSKMDDSGENHSGKHKGNR